MASKLVTRISTDPSESTLHWEAATLHDYPMEVVLMLFNHGIELNYTTHTGMRVVNWAAVEGSMDHLKFFVEDVSTFHVSTLSCQQGADLNGIKNVFKYFDVVEPLSPLAHALFSGSLEKVQYLWEKTRRKDGIEELLENSSALSIILHSFRHGKAQEPTLEIKNWVLEQLRLMKVMELV